MAVYGNTSSKVVINKLYRDLFLEDPSYEHDFIEWMGEALAFIGAATQLVQVEEELEVLDFQANLPTNLVTLNQVKMKTEDDKWKLISYNPTTFQPHDDDFENFYVTTEEYFTLKPNVIQTSFEVGDLKVSMKQIAVDDEGYPLIPDNQYYREALFWFCYKKMLLRGYKSRVEEINYFFADEKWKFYCSAARNQANYPDISGYQRFRDIWVGLMDNQYLDENDFDNRKIKKVPIETVNASNIVTNPMTTEDNE